MRKIKSLFQRNYDTDRLVRDEVVPGSEWVTHGEGWATEKLDGTCCLMQGGKLYKRYDAKHGKTPPSGFIPTQDPDEITGHWPGWILVGDGPEDQWHRQGLANSYGLSPGTYELVGPKIQNNPYQRLSHGLISHLSGSLILESVPRTFSKLQEYLFIHTIEGIVWHDIDGRMVKIRRADFGLPWPVSR